MRRGHQGSLSCQSLGFSHSKVYVVGGMGRSVNPSAKAQGLLHPLVKVKSKLALIRKSREIILKFDRLMN